MFRVSQLVAFVSNVTSRNPDEKISMPRYAKKYAKSLSISTTVT